MRKADVAINFTRINGLMKLINYLMLQVIVSSESTLLHAV